MHVESFVVCIVGKMAQDVESVVGSFPFSLIRAGGNGTAGTAMAVPVFEEKKWCR